MILTERFVFGLVVAAVLIGVSTRLALLAEAGVVLISLDIALAFLDWRRLVRVRIDVTRVCDDKLSLGADNLIRMTIRNPGRTRVVGKLRDEYPEGFECDSNVFSLDIPPRSETSLTYHVTPVKRGDFEFGDVYIRLKGPLGLVIRQIRFPAKRTVKVYPNLIDIRRFELGLRHRIPLQPGRRMVRIRGRGTDFESLRDYMPDDEFRSLDWKATARRGKLTTRQYQEEKSQNVLIVLDAGRVMGSVLPLHPLPQRRDHEETRKSPLLVGMPRTTHLTRLDLSINAAVLLTHVAAQKGDRVGLIAFAEDVISYLPPKPGKSQVLNLLRLTYNLKEASGDSNYARATAFLARKWSRRSLIVFFTDLADPESSKPLIAQIEGLAKRHLCVVATISDPAVLNAARGPFETVDDVFLAVAARQVLHARRLAKAQLVRSGVTVLDLPPNELTSSLVNEYLNLKAQGLL
ncbi:MAG: DUF58 domain-containing protein [Armatimonadetes bacterium]|nr:DUF58 domain-containing protein [Armatimonadota bacterium]